MSVTVTNVHREILVLVHFGLGLGATPDSVNSEFGRVKQPSMLRVYSGL